MIALQGALDGRRQRRAISRNERYMTIGAGSWWILSETPQSARQRARQQSIVGIQKDHVLTLTCGQSPVARCGYTSIFVAQKNDTRVAAGHLPWLINRTIVNYNQLILAM
jgi:hypothetical protein